VSTHETSRLAPTALDGAHALSVETVERALEADREHGLTSSEAEARFGLYGPNEHESGGRPAYVRIAARQFTDPLVALLVGAALVSLAIGEALEAAAIAAIVLVNGVLGFVQEARAERAVRALRDTLQPLAGVVRDGSEREIAVQRIVPGDLVALREGSRVPADGRVVTAAGLAVDESMLTGESVPVDKDVPAVGEDAPLAERSSMAHAGTAVTRGRATMLVTATGAATELGRIAGLTVRTRRPPTPLERRVRGLTRVMVVVGVVVTLALGGAMLATGESLEEAFLVGVSVAVAAVPEGLAATVTVALALGAREMAKRGAVVRRLVAVEALGSATVVATDKTGTLTENRLRLAAVAAAHGSDERDVVRVAALASAVHVLDDVGETRLAGDPVDVALGLAARERGVSSMSSEQARVVHEIPFDPVRKAMTRVFREGDRVHICVKGAPETLLEASTATTDEARALEQHAHTWASEGLRVLAVAERWAPADAPLEGDLERDLDLVGLVGLHDPLRPAATGAMAEARAAGLRVEMVTGDHPVTARAIGRSLGLAEDAIHARITPAGKLELVERLQEEGEVVAVTGDGVNDAPALRRGDVGIAMGRSGTEAAREAAEIVLTDDDFATIVAAIREGRTIADNIRKFVAFLLSANLGEVALFAVAIVAGLGAPLTVVQVLLINVLTDGLPAIALTQDPAAPGLMRRPPERGNRLFSRRAWLVLGAVGLLVGLAAFVAFLVGNSGAPGEAETMAFATIAFAELALVYALRSPIEAAWRAPRNLYLVASVIVSAAIVLVSVYAPVLNGPLGTVPLSVGELGIVVGLSLVPLLLVELGKGVFRALGWSLTTESSAR
jgi:Ca2+-transporting ATPase